jgi:multiple RNA-binding domain-containing protein 1
LIIKNLPKHLTDERLKEHFSKKGIVTDAKIMKKADKSRLFGFVGYKTEVEAAAARKFFNNSFIDTSKIVVDFAKP